MELGTIIVVGHNQAKNSSPVHSHGTRKLSSFLLAERPIVFWDLIGQSVLERTIDRLRGFGVELISVFHYGGYDGNEAQVDLWDKTVLDYARSGVKRILLISLGAYSELDLLDFLRFHSESRSPVTNVVDDRGPLGITLIESKCAYADGAPPSSRLPALLSCSSTYEYSGYSNRLAHSADYRQLAEHALRGLCDIRPVGQEVSPGVWVGEGARIHGSVRILGPSYIGAHSKIRSGSLIASGTTIERQCEIDCGTVVARASILPRTYLGPGLYVSQSIVCGTKLVHLGRNLSLELSETGLLSHLGNPASRRILETLGSFLAFGQGSDVRLSTPSRAPASLDCVRSNGFFD